MTNFDSLTEAQMNKIAFTIRYAESYPALLSKFYHVPQLLLDEMIKNPVNYKAQSVLENGNIKKSLSHLEREYIGSGKIKDLTDTDERVPDKAAEFLSSLVCEFDGVAICIKTGMDFAGDIYQYIARRNHITTKNTVVPAGTVFQVQNRFNCYETEAFILAFRGTDFSVSITPASADGMKGRGEVFIYVLSNAGSYRDLASKYFDASSVLKLFRG